MTLRSSHRVVPAWTIKALLLALPFSMMATNPFSIHVFAAMDSVMTRGDQGAGVSELQSRLGFLGYYHGQVSGHFNWSTYWAVRDFQSAFGMKVDGIAGTATEAALSKATTAWNPGTVAAPSSNGQAAVSQNSGAAASQTTGQPAVAAGNSADATSGLSASDTNLIVHIVYGEARGQPFIGQVAVAAVILNRYHSSKFPHSIPGIIYQPGAFDCVANGQAWLGLHKENVEATMDAVHGFDPTHGALYYWNPATSTSPWIWTQPIMLQIGQHVFAK